MAIELLDRNIIKAAEESVLATGTVKKLSDGGGLLLTVRPAAQGGLRHTRSAWSFRYTLPHEINRREIGLGGYPEVSVAQARRERVRFREIVRGGRDPKTEREAVITGQAERAAEAETAPALWDAVQDTYEMLVRRNKLKPRTRWLAPLKTHIGNRGIGSKRINEISIEEMRDHLLPLWETTAVTGKRLVDRLRTTYRHQNEFHGRSDVNPDFIHEVERRLGDRPDFEVTHIASHHYEDMTELYAALDETQIASLALKFTILTNAQQGPVRFATRDQIIHDPSKLSETRGFNRRVWRMPHRERKASKSLKGDFFIPLSDEAIRILSVADKIRRGDSDLIFPSPQAGKTMSDAAMNAVLKRHKVAARGHGMRSSFRMWASNIGAEFHVAERCMDHVVANQLVVSAYLRDDAILQRSILLDQWAAYLSGAGVGGASVAHIDLQKERDV